MKETEERLKLGKRGVSDVELILSRVSSAQVVFVGFASGMNITNIATCRQLPYI